jgi:2,5-dioxopentanoate dehydrogenase
MSDALAPLLIDGRWQPSRSTEYFQAENPTLGEPMPERYPISTREEVLFAVEAGVAAAEALRTTDGATIARFLDVFADAIERSRDDLVSLAHAESGLPKSPRLMEVELPRTTDQLRQAAEAARNGSWRRILSIIAGRVTLVTIRSNDAPSSYHYVCRFLTSTWMLSPTQPLGR